MKYFKKISSFIFGLILLAMVIPMVSFGAFTDGVWVNFGTYAKPNVQGGLNLLISGSNKYLNWGSTVGTSGYGIRDNSGSMEFKDSGGSWAGFGTGSGGSVTAVTASLPLSSSGGTTPDISIALANSGTSGYLSSTDWNTFNDKVNFISVTSGELSLSGTIQNPIIGLASSGVSAGSYTTANVTVDTYGRVTSISSGAGSSQWITSGSDIYYDIGKVQVGSSTIAGSKFNIYSAIGAIQRLETGTSTLDVDFVTTVGSGLLGINSDAVYMQALDSLSNGIYLFPNTAGNNSLHLLANGHIRHEYSPSVYMDTYVNSGGSANFEIGGGGGLSFNFNRYIKSDEGLLLDTGNIGFYPGGFGGGSSLTVQTTANNRTIEFDTKISGSQAVRGGFYTDGFGITGDFKMTTVGKTVFVSTGTNAKSGTATLSGGTVTINTTAITANSMIMLSVGSGTVTNLGIYSESARTAGTSFTITSLNILDSSTFDWWLVEKI